MKLPKLLAAALLAILGLASTASRAAETQDTDLLVFAAASLSDVLTEIAAQYSAQTGQGVKLSFAASSTLARQIEAGARADVFLSADEEWMDYLATRALLDGATRRDVVGNRLVLIAPSDSRAQLRIAPRFPLAAAVGEGRLATGDPASVPAGRYARAALESLGVWSEIEPRLARAENVRAALAFVARGEAPFGIVYETDALAEKKVRVVDVFPPQAHPRIVYPVAATVAAKSGASRFAQFLLDPAAQATFRRHGFQPIAR
jgi:molybdate transport system substrate-binding protein